MIKQNQKYRTRSGCSARILCTDLRGTHPVAAAISRSDKDLVFRYTEDGRFYLDPNSNSLEDLFELTEWDDYEIDDPVLVKDHRDVKWLKGYFAGVLGGKPATWKYGATSWSKDCDPILWDQCKRADPTN